ncbi:MAG: VWA domain-containing protein [Chloroflexi bacterium]|nr:MAG: VWA domain-containing protein [Chloroflexota bacterium]
MGFELTRPLLLGAGVIALAAVFFTWSRLAPPLAPARARLSLGLRVLIVLLLTGALAGFAFQTSPPEQSVMVLADLSASTQNAVDRETTTVHQILAQRQGKDRAGVVSFGRDPQVEVNVGTDPQFAEFESRPNANYTDLASALQLAGSILPSDTRRHIVIVSDGRANLGDAIAEARLLHAEGVRVDAVALAVPVGSEARVDRLDAPRTINQGEQASAQAVIVSNVATTATARWYVDRTLVGTAQVDLVNGETTLAQTFKPTGTGFHSVRMTIDPVLDTYAENNVGEALVQVVGPPRVLVVEQAAGDAASLEAALSSTGIPSTTIVAAQLPKTASDLAAYQSVVLVNISAASLGVDGMALLQAATRDLGIGLVVIGGTESYGPGGYAGTSLEAILPVQIELPQNMQKPPVAVMLVLETTESTEGDLVLRGAANALIDQLTPRDSVGVTNGMGGNIVVPLTQLTDKAKVKASIAGMNLGDPPSYGPDLNAAAAQLDKSKASLKHIILLGDGDATFGNYQSIVEGLYKKGITVSTVAAGAYGTDPGLMRQIAQWGHGRAYVSNSVRVLQSPTGDPVLATWEYGLGRVMAWTSDAQGRWTAGLLRWPSANRFFGDIVRYTLPQAGDPALQMETQVQGDHTHILVTAPSYSGAAVAISAVTPDLSDRELTLVTTGPGRFEGDLPTDQVGSYLLHVTQSAGGAVKHTNTFGVVVPYSPEYRELGTDLNSLRAVARAGGGTVITDVSQVFRVPVPEAHAAQALDELLLVLAIILFPLDVALRRLILRVEDVPAWRAAFKRKPARAIAAEATVGRLKERVAGVRSARAPMSAPPEPKPEKTIEDLRARRKR